jgi:hypothetical protein
MCIAWQRDTVLIITARLVLNDYKTEWVEYPDLAPTFKSLYAVPRHLSSNHKTKINTSAESNRTTPIAQATMQNTAPLLSNSPMAPT